MKTFYTLHTNPAKPDLPFTIIKFDQDLNPESSYSVGNNACECPAGHRPKCRHREMLPVLRQRIDTAWFFCFETKSWEDPTGEAAKHQEVEEHDAETGGLDAQEEYSTEVSDPVALDERFHVPTRDDNTDKGTDEGFLSNPSLSNPSPLGNPAPNPAPQGAFKRRL